MLRTTDGQKVVVQKESGLVMLASKNKKDGEKCRVVLSVAKARELAVQLNQVADELEGK